MGSHFTKKPNRLLTSESNNSVAQVLAANKVSVAELIAVEQVNANSRSNTHQASKEANAAINAVLAAESTNDLQFPKLPSMQVNADEISAFVETLNTEKATSTY